MKMSRIIIIVVVVIVIVIIGLFAYETLAINNGNGNSLWSRAAEYPINVSGTYGVGGQQCVNSSAYIYCVGGVDANNGPRNDVYTSNALSPSFLNISSWAPQTNLYPLDINAPSCVSSSGTLYCIGGIYDDNGDDTASTYYAALTGGSVGKWISTTAYPIPTDTQSCVSSASFVYCVGGNNETNGLSSNARNSSSVWYAPLSSSGIGNWSLTAAYPGGFYPVCYTAQQTIYCLGGILPDGNSANSVYYAALSAKGVGPWTQTTSYPASLAGQACTILSSTIFCVGGEGNGNAFSHNVYYATVSSSGVGPWKTGPAYPVASITDCVSVHTEIYCIGGFVSSSSNVTPEVYFASQGLITGTTTTT